MTSSPQYVGKELDLFRNVTNWKRYWSSFVTPYVKGTVLEVGAGIGANTPYLKKKQDLVWVCLEPDRELAARLRSRIADDPVFYECVVIESMIEELEPERRFDTILYIDVLEHIENDSAELSRAASLLQVGGALIVLSPAHQSLFSRFDQSIGHFRRYNKKTLSAVAPERLTLRRLFYLDSVGLALSLANRLLLRQSLPTSQQLEFWDSFLIPLSRILDPLLFRSFGKTIVGIFQQPDLENNGKPGAI